MEKEVISALAEIDLVIFFIFLFLFLHTFSGMCTTHTLLAAEGLRQHPLLSASLQMHLNPSTNLQLKWR